jgi:hypothetical protein
MESSIWLLLRKKFGNLANIQCKLTGEASQEAKPPLNPSTWQTNQLEVGQPASWETFLWTFLWKGR